MTDSIRMASGKEFRFTAPPQVDALPSRGFIRSDQGAFAAPLPNPVSDATVNIRVNPKSTRLELLAPFPKWNGAELERLPVLLKVVGKCTTDHISAAGPWLKYKGHLTNISQNTLMTAMNSFTSLPNVVTHPLTNTPGTVHDTAKSLFDTGTEWCMVGDENYGEGSAREHAALQKRFLGCRVVIVRSFARIHGMSFLVFFLFVLSFVHLCFWFFFVRGFPFWVGTGRGCPHASVLLLIRCSAILNCNTQLANLIGYISDSFDCDMAPDT